MDQEEMEMKDTTARRRPPQRKITFSLDAPDASAVYLVGEFNGWSCKKHPMRRKEDGLWKKQVSLPEGRFEYKFLVDEQWREDPLNERMCPNCFGTRNNIVNVRI
jgi:1,4-alpha-glucan branching enzyme